MLILGMGLVAILSILAILAIVLGLTRNDGRVKLEVRHYA